MRLMFSSLNSFWNWICKVVISTLYVKIVSLKNLQVFMEKSILEVLLTVGDKSSKVLPQVLTEKSADRIYVFLHTAESTFLCLFPWQAFTIEHYVYGTKYFWCIWWRQILFYSWHRASHWYPVKAGWTEACVAIVFAEGHTLCSPWGFHLCNWVLPLCNYIS